MVKEKELYTPVEVADKLRISVKTLYGWIAEGKIEAVRVGPTPSKLIRIQKAVVETMIQSTLV